MSLIGRILLLLACLSVARPLSAAAADPPAPDLSAMMLTATELNLEGLGEYLPDNGWTETLDDEFVNLFVSGGIETTEIRQRLEDAGFEQSRGLVYLLPSQSDPSLAVGGITITIDSFSSDNDLSDVLDLYMTIYGDQIDSNDFVGDDSRAMQFSGGSGNGTFNSVLIMFSLDNLIARVEMWNYQSLFPDDPPTVKQVGGLAQRLADRMDTIGAGAGTSLDGRVLRLDTDGRTAGYNWDYYERLNGTQIRQFSVSEEETSADDSERDEGKVLDEYRLEQWTSLNNLGDTLWSVRLLSFESEDDAAAYLENTQDREANRPDIAGLKFASEAPALGDSAIAWSYREGNADAVDTDKRYRMVSVQVGSVVADIGVASPRKLAPAGVVAGLAELQVACLEDGGCPLDEPIPTDLIEFGNSLAQ